MKVKKLLRYLESHPNKDDDVFIRVHIKNYDKPIISKPTLRTSLDSRKEIIFDTELINVEK